jgi:hypothetical protein
MWEVDITFTAGDSGTVTVQSDIPLFGVVRRIDVKPYTALAQNATIKIYESTSLLTTPHMPLSLTQAASNAEKVVLPVVAATDNTGAAVSSQYVPYFVHGYLTMAFASYVSTNRVVVRVFIETGGA